MAQASVLLRAAEQHIGSGTAAHRVTHEPDELVVRDRLVDEADHRLLGVDRAQPTTGPRHPPPPMHDEPRLWSNRAHVRHDDVEVRAR